MVTTLRQTIGSDIRESLIRVAETRRLREETEQSLLALHRIVDEQQLDTEQRAISEEQDRQYPPLEGLNQLAMDVAHEFNNILTGIIGLAQITLARLDDDSPFPADLHEIVSLSHRAADLTQQLLNSGCREPFIPRVLDVNTLINNSLNMLRWVLKDDIELQFIPGNISQTHNTNPAQLEQVLLYLAVNARHAMPNGGVLMISTESIILKTTDAASKLYLQPGEYIVISMTDTGCYQGEDALYNSDKQIYTNIVADHGTVLRLNLANRMIKQNVGSLHIYSDISKRSTVNIYLPCHNISINQQAESPANIAIGTESILLVEDEPSVRNIARRVLTAFGYTVFESASSHEAEAIFIQHRDEISLLITDIVLSSGNGIELGHQLQTYSPSLQVLLMSGYNENSLPKYPKDNAIYSFIQKPFMPGDLLQHVQQLLNALQISTATTENTTSKYHDPVCHTSSVI